jgi:transposase
MSSAGHRDANNASQEDPLSSGGVFPLTAIADRGYFKGEEILACHEAGISALVPKVKTSNAKADGRFDKADFIDDLERDEFRCPAGQALIWRFASIENGLKNHRYWSSNCKDCPLKAKCTPSQQRRVMRWEHQGVLGDMQTRLDQNPYAMRIRRSSVEHPNGHDQITDGRDALPDERTGARENGNEPARARL